MESRADTSSTVNQVSLITYTWFKSLYDKVGTVECANWSDFVKRLYELSYQALYSKKDDVPCFVLAKTSDGKAVKSSVIGTTAIGLDYDLGECDFHEACEFWQNTTGFGYTTWSSGDECQKFRIILRISRPLMPDEHPRIWKYLATLLSNRGVTIDIQTSNPERKWFIPTTPIGGTEPDFLAWQGDPLDVDKILALNGHAHEAQPRASPPPKSTNGTSGLGHKVYQIANRIRATPKGERNYEWNKDIYSLGGLFAGGRLPEFEEDEIIRLLFDAVKANSDNPDREWKKFSKSWEDGKREPLNASERQRKVANSSEPELDNIDEWASSLQRHAEKHHILKTADNYRIIFENAPFTKSLVFDEFYDSLFVRADGISRQFDENADIFFFNIWLSQQNLIEIPFDNGFRMLVGHSKTQSRCNALQDHLRQMQWDGVPRLDTWLIRYLGAEDTEYNRQVGRLWLISAMARAFRPGCQADYAIILEGPQGIGKSTALRILGGNFYSGNLSPIGSKDAYQEIGRVWIQELSELEAFNRGQIEAIKNFLTATNDIYRPSYGKIAVDHPRRCVFAGTSNEAEYLKDQSGNRRFWPVRVTQLDVDALIADREALLAEARVMFEQGAKWWPGAEVTRLAGEEQELRRAAHPWEVNIGNYIAARNEVRIDEIRSLLNIDLARWGRTEQMEAGRILRAVYGWSRVKKRVGTLLVWTYCRPVSPPK